MLRTASLAAWASLAVWLCASSASAQTAPPTVAPDASAVPSEAPPASASEPTEGPAEPAEATPEPPVAESPTETASGAAAVSTQPDPARSLFEWAAEHPSPAGELCRPQRALVRGTTGYVACGAEGLWVYVRRPGAPWMQTETLPAPGSLVTGVRLVGEHVYAEVARPTAVPIAELRGAGQKTPAGVRAGMQTATNPRWDESLVRIESVKGMVLQGHMASPGAFRRREHVELLDGQGEPLAVARVAKVRGTGVWLTLGYQEKLDQQDIASARATFDSLTSPRVAPLRPKGTWIGTAHVRPFVAVSDGGGGVLADLTLDHVFHKRAFLRAQLLPVGIAKGPEDDFDFEQGGRAAGAAMGAISGGLDTRFFALGLGVGFSSVGRTDGNEPAGWGTVFPLNLRVGARDGLSLELRGDTTLFLSDLRFTGLFGTLNVPMTHRISGQLRGGGGRLGVSYGEVALRTLARGNGGPGSWFWELSLGGAGFARTRCQRPTNDPDGVFRGCRNVGETFYGGPIFGAGVEKRF